MSINTGYCFVIRIYAENETFYLTNYVGGITLDSEAYRHYVQSVGQAEKIGNFGEEAQYGKCSVSLIHATTNYQGKYTFNSTKVWNNKKCEIRLCKIGTDTQWSTCDYYYRGVIKNLKLTIGSVEFDVDDYDNSDDLIVPWFTAETAVTNLDYLGTTEAARLAVLPQNSKGKRVPMQYGNLSDTSNGIFAKALPISNKIGMQEIWVDRLPPYITSNIGVWENSLKRYFTGLAETTDPATGNKIGEYLIDSGDYRYIKFRVDTVTTLAADITAVDASFAVGDYTKILWSDEDSESEWETLPELLSVNIIAIDNELMLLIDKPSGATIYVERGYNNTTAAAHSTGAVIYQSARYAAKNLLSFMEVFYPTAITNQYFGKIIFGGLKTKTKLLTADGYSSGRWDSLLDSDDTNNINFYMPIGKSADGDDLRYYMNFDMKFATVKDQFTVKSVFVACKCSIDTTISSNTSETIVGIYILVPSVTTTYNNDLQNLSGVTDYCSHAIAGFTPGTTGETGNLTINSLNTPNRNIVQYVSGASAGGYTYYQTIYRISYYQDFLSSLTGLNDKFKIHIGAWSANIANPAAAIVSLTLYKLGFWIEFFTDFTSRTMLSSLYGRQPCSETTAVFTTIGSGIGDYIANPVYCIADILVRERSSLLLSPNFDTTSWDAALSWSMSFPPAPASAPVIAMSWGVEDSEKIWTLCQRIASHFLYSLIRTYDGKIGIINLAKLQYKNNTYGYGSLTAYKVSLSNDILMPSSEKSINIQQTGTDQLYNDIIIHYKRNNSTDEYQEHYTLPATYTLPESSITLAAARVKYYEGQKRTLEVESPFIYNATDAQRLAEWHANDKAEVFFWAEFTVDYEQYSRAGKAAQYFPGDVIYLDGTYADIVLDSTHKWIVREVILKNDGDEVEIHAKSIEPIGNFTSNSIGQNTTYQNTVDDDDICQNTVDSTTIRQNKV